MILLKDRQTDEICLLTGVNISFEAIEGGDMENVAAVSMLRDACAVFQLTAIRLGHKRSSTVQYESRRKRLKSFATLMHLLLKRSRDSQMIDLRCLGQ
jgi:hypothetical protein